MCKIETIIHTLDNLILSDDNLNAMLLSLSSNVGEIRRNELSRMPLHINVITISAVGRLKETAHSSILQHLLRHQSILDSFIVNIVGINDIEVKSENVRPAEQDRIDISIYDKDICLIIENKVNDAVEQQSQVYRYVKMALEAGYKEKQIRVLYLNSNHHNKPSDNSLTFNDDRIPKTIENNLVVKDYAHDIYEWLKDLPSIIPEDQKYIISALHQYQDYLEEYFYLTNKFDNMKQRIKTTIIENILKNLSDENDPDFSKRINALEEAAENLEQLMEGVKDLTNDLSAKRYAISVKKESKRIQTELALLQLTLIDLSDYGYVENNYGVKISLNNKVGYIAFGYDSEYYICFAFNTSLLTKEKNFLNRIFKKCGKTSEEEADCLPCWCYIGEKNLLNEYCNLVQYVKDQSTADEDYIIKFL